MQPFTIVAGAAAPLPSANVDTDVIMPKQYLKGVDRSGLRDGTLRDLRFDPAGAERPEFTLNQPAWRDAPFLVVGPNFGCGSSREHAVWGLGQLGIRALIGTSFAGIFFDNCARNGLLAISLDELSVKALADLVSEPASNRLVVDLAGQTIATADGSILPFAIEADRKAALLTGLDAIGSTLAHREDIAAFERGYLEANPWLA